MGTENLQSHSAQDVAQASAEETLTFFSVDPTTGLNSSTVTQRESQFGKNVLQHLEVKWWKIARSQVQNAFFWVLFVAGVVALVLGEMVDATFIFAFITINTTLGFYQEWKSQQSLKMLNQFVERKVFVIRNGEHIQIVHSDVVPGDIILIEAGDIVPADARIIETNECIVDESSLTGETREIEKTDAVIAEARTIFDQKNCVFSGTKIISGSAKAIVFATGVHTEMGRTQAQAQVIQPESLYQQETRKLSRFIFIVVICSLFVIVGLNIWDQEEGTKELFLFAIALAVSVIPEALPLVVTFTFSRGALKLAKQHVLVKRLAAIEDLGGIEILCSDKTGTLTENTLSVANTFTTNSYTKEELLSFAYYGNVNHTTVKQVNNSFDVAVESVVDKKAIEQSTNIFAQVPFDPRRRRSSTLIEVDSARWIIVRGAPESLAELSVLESKDNQAIQEFLTTEGRQGRRVLAVARKQFLGDTFTDKDEVQLEFLGCISFEDPIKDTAIAAIQQAKALNVQLKILTGDSPDVAASVAHQIGLIEDVSHVLTGDDIHDLDQEQLQAAAETCHVFARVTPEQKFRIIQALQTKASVGFLGEGINDAPALHVAQVGIVVDHASDIARDAADIILLKESLHTIINGIAEGRRIFANTTKYIRITLTSNFGNFYAVSLSSLFITYLPLLPVQLLALNLLSDFPMLAIAGDNIDDVERARPSKSEFWFIVKAAIFLGAISTVVDFSFFFIFRQFGESILQTAWFTGSVLTEIVVIFSLRTRKIFFRSSTPSPVLMLVAVTIIAVTIALPFTPFGAIMNFTILKPQYIGWILSLVATYFFANELGKLYLVHIVNRRRNR